MTCEYIPVLLLVIYMLQWHLLRFMFHHMTSLVRACLYIWLYEHNVLILCGQDWVTWIHLWFYLKCTHWILHDSVSSCKACLSFWFLCALGTVKGEGCHAPYRRVVGVIISFPSVVEPVGGYITEFVMHGQYNAKPTGTGVNNSAAWIHSFSRPMCSSTPA